MRVVDLRGTSSRPPELEVRASEPAELLRLIGVLVSADSLVIPGDYDVGPTRIDEVRGGLPAGIVDRARALGDDRSFLSLSITAARLPADAGTDELLAALEDDPAASWRVLVSLGSFDGDWDDAATIAKSVAAGDTDATEELRRRCAAPSAPEELRELLAADPVAHGREIAAIAREVRDAVWNDVAAESMGAIERDVAHRRERIAAGDDPHEIVLTATNGYDLGDDPSVRRVLLLPSFWLRPWLVVDQLGDRLVISNPVADEFVALPTEAPSPALLKLFKALSDEGRLKLLRRLASGPLRLGEAAEHLDVAKATAHHHLSMLRQAGLVTMSGEGRGTRYALRDDPADAAREALRTYVPQRS